MTLQRKPMKRRPIVRQWHDAIEKVESEGKCRICGASDFVDAAHLIGRKYDKLVVGPRGGKTLYVEPDSVVGLCGAFSREFHHGAYDRHELDLWSFLTDAEIEYAVGMLGFERARRRISGGVV